MQSVQLLASDESTVVATVEIQDNGDIWRIGVVRYRGPGETDFRYFVAPSFNYGTISPKYVETVCVTIE